jgi:hypothetical protein
MQILSNCTCLIVLFSDCSDVFSPKGLFITICRARVYALLCLVAEPSCCYPGIVVIDFPLQLASGQTIRDKENYLVEPFVKLCASPNMNGSQFIAAGHSFDQLTGANVIEVARA